MFEEWQKHIRSHPLTFEGIEGTQGSLGVYLEFYQIKKNDNM